jgi:L-methionine (R)-S-oxide reductase
VLGPFQGRPACTRIPFGKGVCGLAARDKKTVVVADLHDFPDHIACDANSRSEIVVPLVSPAGLVVGVLDLDSPLLRRFGDHERKLCEALSEIASRWAARL